jgi:hypothetical protein
LSRARLGGWILWPASIIFASLIAAPLVLGGTPVRPYLTLVFMLLCPGLALVRLLGIGDSLLEIAAAVAISIALELLAALVMVYAGFWSPEGLFIGFVTISVVAAGLDLAGFRLRAEEQP